MTMIQDREAQLSLELTKSIMDLLDSWGLANSDKITILGMPPSTRIRTMLQHYKDRPLPQTPEVMERVDHIIGIADALHTSYPLNAHMASFWMNKKNQRFDNRTPLALILEDGLEGLVRVRAHLDCAWDWSVSGSQP